MIISRIELYNFRQFQALNNEPGLTVEFHQGLNALIGENDAGKSSLIDAIKIVLLTQSNEYIRIVDEDFYSDGVTTANEVKINITFSEFTENEAKNFVEYLTFQKDSRGATKYFLNLYFRAWKEKNRIFTDLRCADENEGVSLGSKARELLRCVYLKPLRDAEREMHSGRNSRISQILANHPVFKETGGEHLSSIIENANEKIGQFFTDEEGREILTSIRDTLSEFNEMSSDNSADINTATMQLKSILESLSLSATEIGPGLGQMNLLFIAAELLLLKNDNVGGVKLALIEELEAHLHPQAQLRLIQYLQKEYQNTGVQIIITTHSPILASKINLKNIILLKNRAGYDLSENQTKLEKGDYLFLQRFLDSSKANLFFAKGIIMVEGDAENILVPEIARIIGYPLEKYGVSIVNVGSTAFLRYSKIFVRNDGKLMNIPVSIITDCDVKPKYDEEEDTIDLREQETTSIIRKKNSLYTDGDVKAFVSPRWTLEYCIGLSCLQTYFHTAIHYGKKIKNSDEFPLTAQKINAEDKAIEQESKRLNASKNEIRAYKIYKQMLNEDGKSGLKAIVAQVLAALLRWTYVKVPDSLKQTEMFDLDLYQYKQDEKKQAELRNKIMADSYLKYIVDAIKYAVGEENKDKKAEST